MPEGDVTKAAREDPFTRGLDAFVGGHARTACPFPPAFFEAAAWLGGWDHGYARRDHNAHVLAFRRRTPAASVKSWRATEMVVLRSLASRGESVRSLAARFNCSPATVLLECERQAILISEAQRG